VYKFYDTAKRAEKEKGSTDIQRIIRQNFNILPLDITCHSPPLDISNTSPSINSTVD